jgi:hypothetical protein
VKAATELWRPVPGFEGLYEVSDRGKVKSLARTVTRKNGQTYPLCERILKPCFHRDGYLWVKLYRNDISKMFFIHRLMLLAFRGPPADPNMDGCHENDIKSDNRLSNLQWKTTLANIADRTRNGNTARGSRAGKAKLTESKVLDLRNRYAAGVHYKTLARQFGVAIPTIPSIVQGRSWKHVGGPITHRGHAAGSRMANAKLTESAIPIIRQRSAAGATRASLAREYGVSESTILHIVQGKVWKGVPA